jgi:serine/threonine protein kinase
VDEVVFGRYRLLSVIGEGGMGKVYKAHDTMMDRDVAIKVLPTERATEPGYEQRFRREAHIAARLTEPHIIPIYEAGEIEGRLYLVMPVIEGIDVGGLLQRDGPMSPQRAVHMIEQLAAALDAAHAVGLVHRDIKPSNALVTGRDFVYLIDFGIAHDAAATKLTSTGMLVGTLSYMAPERFTAGTADARSDVYALACVLHECLTGNPPYPGKSMEQQIAGHLTQDPPRPTAHRPDLPIGFDEVIATGMAKDPEKRYQSAHELATAAHHALTTAPSRSPHPAPTLDTTQPAPTLQGDQLPAPPAPVPVRQQPGDLNLAATQQQRPLGGSPVPQARPADRPPPQPVLTVWWRQRRPGLIAAIVGTVVILAAAGITGYLLRSHSPASQTPTAQPALPSGRTAQPAPPSAPAQPTDYTGLLIQATDIDAPVQFTGSPPVKNPNGQPGIATTFSTQDGSHAIKDTIQVLADPAAATDALNAAKGGQGNAIKDPQTGSANVGTGATTLSGNAPDKSKGVTILLFTEGRAFVTLEFDGPTDSLPPQDFVNDVAQKQDAAIKKGLGG